MKYQLIIIVLFFFGTNILHAQEGSQDYEKLYDQYLDRIVPFIIQAHEQIELPKKAWESRKDSASVYVTVILRNEEYRWEQVFLEVLDWENEQITGRLVSQMNVVEGYPFGSIFELQDEQIVDWLVIFESGREEGNFVVKGLSGKNIEN